MNFLIPYLLPILLGALGYLFVYYFWEPIRQMDVYKQEIITIVTNYANIRQYFTMRKNHDYNGPGDMYEQEVLNQAEIEKTSHHLRKLAGQLRAVINTKKTYDLLSHLNLVPKRSNVEDAAKSLVGWSNSFGVENESKLIGDFINELTTNLNIPVS